MLSLQKMDCFFFCWSTFVGYLFIFVIEQQSFDLTHSGGEDSEVHSFPKYISLKVNDRRSKWLMTMSQSNALAIIPRGCPVGNGIWNVSLNPCRDMCYNQTGYIFTLDRTPLKLVDKFTYLGSSVSSTEKDIDTRLTKAWRAINRLSIIWKSDLTDKMKRSSFQAAVVSILLYGCTTWTLTKRL